MRFFTTWGDPSPSGTGGSSPRGGTSAPETAGSSPRGEIHLQQETGGPYEVLHHVARSISTENLEIREVLQISTRNRRFLTTWGDPSPLRSLSSISTKNPEVHVRSSISTKEQEIHEVLQLHHAVNSIFTKNLEVCEVLHDMVSSNSTKNLEVHEVLHHVLSSISTKNQEVHEVLHHVVSSIFMKNLEVHVLSSISTKNQELHELLHPPLVLSSISTRNSWTENIQGLSPSIPTRTRRSPRGPPRPSGCVTARFLSGGSRGTSWS
nr:uncharacterized protein LOC106630150 isoform X1 [Zonotrichia albicollis]XP_026654724.1 uncharacterized protein LOC106630150 isoform X1 [Zonotrichia albicollis]XP_026654725.1 uncharacterized protein LOC106630150 isoform X2 [Zonotrichia albicollis]